MELTYLDYLFLDLFSTKESRKINSLFHILSGKRTVSVLMQAKRMDLEAYYAFFPKLQQSFFEERIKLMMQLELLNADYQLTAEGNQRKHQYFMSHARPDLKEQLKYQAISALFKMRCLFLTQVLSERVHESKKYYPIQPRLFEQRWLKHFLVKHDLTSVSKSQILGEEWLRILAEPEIQNPEIFVAQFEGYHKSKQTNKQMSDEYNLDPVEVYVLLQREWIQLLITVNEKPQEYPLLSTILAELKRNAGLCSESTQETYRMWADGVSLEQVAERRRLKQSTINDHLTEMAILYETFPYEEFLSEEQLAYIEAEILAGKPVDYNEIQQAFPDVSFFQSRLMQVKGEVHDDRK